MINLLKRLFCKHNYILESKFYGDMKNLGAGVYVCKKCNKRRIF